MSPPTSVMEKKYSTEDAYAALCSYCARAERSPRNVAQKLASWGFRDSDEVDAIVERLTSEKYLDEERYARAFVRDKSQFNGWGEMRLRVELQHQGIAGYVIKEALREWAEEYDDQEQLRELLSSKLRTYPENLEPRKLVDRLLRFSAYRGYPFEKAYEVIRSLIDEL